MCFFEICIYFVLVQRVLPPITESFPHIIPAVLHSWAVALALGCTLYHIVLCPIHLSLFRCNGPDETTQQTIFISTWTWTASLLQEHEIPIRV